MKRSGERGSVIGFIVVGVVLAALVLGSIYVAKQVMSGAFNKTTSEVATSTKNAADETKQTVQESLDKATKSDNKDQEATTKEEEQKTETAQSQTADQSDDQNTDSEGASQDSAKSETLSQVPQTGVTAEPSHLPQTGPAETLITAMIVSLLVGSTLAYRRSLRV